MEIDTRALGIMIAILVAGGQSLSQATDTAIGILREIDARDTSK